MSDTEDDDFKFSATQRLRAIGSNSGEHHWRNLLGDAIASLGDQHEVLRGKVEQVERHEEADPEDDGHTPPPVTQSDDDGPPPSDDEPF